MGLLDLFGVFSAGLILLDMWFGGLLLCFVGGCYWWVLFSWIRLLASLCLVALVSLFGWLVMPLVVVWPCIVFGLLVFVRWAACLCLLVGCMC